MFESDDPRDQILGWLSGAQASQVLAAVVELGLAEVLTEQPRPAEDLAVALDVAPQSLLRLLRTMSRMALCEETRPGEFVRTPAGALLSQRNPGSLCDTVRLSTAPSTRLSWSRLAHSIHTGRAGFDAAQGISVFDYLAEDTELADLYHRYMGAQNGAIGTAVRTRYDFDLATSVVDVGGGDGSLLTTVLAGHPRLHGTVFDNHEGAAHAAATIHAAGLADRCTVTAGDFFAVIPAGADLYLLKWILHDWDDDRAVTILERCRAALPAHGAVLLIEYVLPNPDDQSAALADYLADLNMLVIYGGRRRTQDDFEKLCAAAGLRISRIIPLPEHPGLQMLEVVAC